MFVLSILRAVITNKKIGVIISADEIIVVKMILRKLFNIITPGTDFCFTHRHSRLAGLFYLFACFLF